jgi:hypothetical protein
MMSFAVRSFLRLATLPLRGLLLLPLLICLPLVGFLPFVISGCAMPDRAAGTGAHG